ncbi:AraC family transcriptional regulator [Paenibacillus sp. PK3_47]|uniref:AraC family transcriptional regulator n=1 Tax=Paenibacillus sp. PK3_47 TaxID=2072642 RepID=UPI00201DA84C|nr:AraC family transcriptional regulator [Paenibacillus sp. PK3_47]UQZ37248.1 AraC family transcriptional regulator [Paenibacillus sp. PK3_47]
MQRKSELFTSESLLHNPLHLLVNRVPEGFYAPFHAHDFIELCYVAEGRGYHHIEDEIIPVQKGMLFVLPVGVSHVFRPATPDASGNRLIVYNCLFDNHMVERLMVIVQEPPILAHLSALAANSCAYYHIHDHNGRIENLLLDLYRESYGDGTGSETMLITLVSQLVVTVYRTKSGETGKCAEGAAEFAHILRYLENRLAEPLTLKELSESSGWSVRHLQRMFHKHTGQTFGSYLQNLRVQKSCELLRSTSLKIHLIAEAAGYRDTDSFHAVFKKITGLTPLEYRKLHNS